MSQAARHTFSMARPIRLCARLTKIMCEFKDLFSNLVSDCALFPKTCGYSAHSYCECMIGVPDAWRIDCVTGVINAADDFLSRLQPRFVCAITPFFTVSPQTNSGKKLTRPSVRSNTPFGAQQRSLGRVSFFAQKNSFARGIVGLWSGINPAKTRIIITIAWRQPM